MLLHSQLGEHLDSVLKLFKPEARPKVMLVVLNEGLADGDVVIGNADPTKAVAAIVKLHGKAGPV